jgi:hypothetical protein
MTDYNPSEPGDERDTAMARGPREEQVTGAVAGMSGVQVGLLLLLLLLNLLVLWFLWGIVSAT